MTKLKEKRTEQGITQLELAVRSETNLRNLQDYEQGHKDINKACAITVYKLAQALNCKVEDILEI